LRLAKVTSRKSPSSSNHTFSRAILFAICITCVLIATSSGAEISRPETSTSQTHVPLSGPF
jgi:hypothetical protein